MSAHEDAGRPAHRTKLTTHDVRLIFYLIIRIKPFKYVGDRALSQTKKWRLIQQQYADIKTADAGPKGQAADIVVPTVRTLQRQLATAIKKARFRLGASAETGLTQNTDLLNSVTRDSLLNDLELALYELHHLSDRLKAGKGSASTPETPANADASPLLVSPSVSAAPGAAEAAAAARLALQQASETRNALQDDLDTGASLETVIGLLTTLIHQNNDYTRELERLVDATVAFISRQTELLQAAVESNRAARAEQAELNRQVILDVIERMNEGSGPVSEPPAPDSSRTHLLKSLQELLN